jgi:hypothetical protein
MRRLLLVILLLPAIAHAYAEDCNANCTAAKVQKDLEDYDPSLKGVGAPNKYHGPYYALAMGNRHSDFIMSQGKGVSSVSQDDADRAAIADCNSKVSGIACRVVAGTDPTVDGSKQAGCTYLSVTESTPMAWGEAETPDEAMRICQRGGNSCKPAIGFCVK